MPNFFAVTLAAAGVPQSLAGAALPTQPTLSVQGVTSSIGGAQQPQQVIVQSDPANAGNCYLGSKSMVKGTRAGVGAVLVPGASVTLGNGAVGVVLDQVWADTDTAANKLLVTTLG